MSMTPFTLTVPDETLDSIRQRVIDYPWHEMPDDKHEAAINRFDNYKTEVNDIDLHYIYEKGSGDSPMPMVLTHGWPGTVVEFLDFIEPLAHPERFGGDVKDAFDERVDDGCARLRSVSRSGWRLGRYDFDLARF